jgi:hypothetical protein
VLERQLLLLRSTPDSLMLQALCRVTIDINLAQNLSAFKLVFIALYVIGILSVIGWYFVEAG